MSKEIILVPVDFSNNAQIATRYALELGRLTGRNIHLLHAYQPFTSAFQSPLANKTDEERAKLGAEKNLAEFLENLGDSAGVTVTTGILRSNLLDAIKEYLENNQVALVVMGTHGESGPRKDLLGSNTYDVAKTIDRPLLIVPEQIAPFRMEKAVFFTDYQAGDMRTLKVLSSLFADQTPSCVLVHIDGKSEVVYKSEHPQRQKLEDWKRKLASENPLIRLSIELVPLKEEAETVRGVLDRLHADLTLLTVVGERSFFKRLLHKSLAREIILNPQTPVLLTSRTKD